ncbi:MAG: CoA-binding protein [Dehalococcoidales bacterium]|nr:CoA-binding protein [Dehalococcoidales bacterium]
MKVDYSKLDRAFNPKCLVVVGGNPRWLWLRDQKHFEGNLYSVQVNPETIKDIEEAGITNFLSVKDIPEPVDLVIMSAPRSAAVEVLKDCIEKDVAAAHFFTAGFSETGTEEGIKLEAQLTEIAEKANFHLIGPNCMGIYNPKMSLGQIVWDNSGPFAPVSIISQSGTHTTTLGQQLHLQGIGMCKAVSFGNGIVLDSTEYLEYFAQDAETEVIGMYLEGVKDSRHFMKVLKEVTAKKPVVIWKGGRSEEGERAILSHTGSLSVSTEIWDSAIRQCGAINVYTMDELVDTIKALLYFPPVKGKRVGIAGGSGGQSVMIADGFASAGLYSPPLTEKSTGELSEFLTVIGGSYKNPIDTGSQPRNKIPRIMDVLDRDENIDNLVLLTGARWGMTETPKIDIDSMVEIKEKSSKPVMAIVSYSTPEEMQGSLEAMYDFQEKGVPAFPTIERGANALKNAFDYYNYRKNG